MTVGVKVESPSINKDEVKKRVDKIRTTLLYQEEMYYGFRDEMEKTIQDIKYQLDKLLQQTGD
jgi:hypothetical protein